MHLPGYQKIREIHRGRKRVIYRARRESGDCPVIIKTFAAEFPSAGDVAALRHEYDVLKRLDIDGVIQAYALEAQQNRPALILEDIDGQPLKHYAQSQQIDLQTLLDIAIKLSATLGELHNHNVIHKDINPKNIILNFGSGEMRLIDFSLSSLLPVETAKISHPDVMEGTLAYMSPEQTGRMNRALDYRTDLYSLGVTFYELLTGALPFNSDDPLEIVHWHIAKAPADPRELNPKIPEMLARIVLKLLAKTAEQRYHSGFGVSADLETCRQQLRATGKITLFTLGERDTRDRFYIPQKLYGREPEIENLLTAFQRVSDGACELMLVCGYAGVGKTSLIQEIHKPVVGSKGFFISGKFDQLSRQMPYTAIIQAFQELVRLILTESEGSIRLWKKQLLAALGNNAQVIIDVIPELELILGQQPAPPQLAPAEAQNRFDLYFQKFIGVFASPDHPLALFLDDLQWADPASLRLLQTIITGMEIRNFLLIGAYRDNEVNDHHPLIKSVQELRKGNTVIHEMVLRPLDFAATNQLIADTLSCGYDHAEPLADLIHKKTAGNPFFVKAFLTSLHEEEMLRYERPAGWQWDLQKIHAMQATDNVVDLMTRKLNRLPEPTLEVLKLAACIGNRFSVETLAMVCENSMEEISSRFFPALQENLLERMGDHYTFFHDRIQEAAYSLIAEDDKKRAHLKVGRLMLTQRDLHENLFDAVDHLNMAAELIIDEKERRECARLNLMAGQKAKSSTAYKPALNYFQTGIDFLPTDSWTSHYDVTFNLHRELAECEYLCGNFDESEHHFDLLLKKAQTRLEKAEIHNLRIIQYENMAKYSAAVQAGRVGLQLFDLTLPTAEAKKRSAFGDEMQIIAQLLGQRAIADLINLPVMEDPQTRMCMKLLMTAWAPAYIAGDVPLTILISAKMVSLSLQRGNCEESAYAYVIHGVTVGTGLGDFAAGYEFGRLALAVNEKFHDLKLRAKVHHMFSCFVNFWRQPLRTCFPHSKEAYRAGLEAGDLAYATYAVIHESWHAFFSGYELPQFVKDFTPNVSFLTQIKNYSFAEAQNLILHWALSFQGKTKSPLGFSTDAFDENSYEKTYRGNAFFETFYCLTKLHVHFVFGEYQQAEAFARRGEGVIHALHGTLWDAAWCFYFAMTLARLHSQAMKEQQKENWQRLESLRAKMKTWAENCPQNFQHLYELIAAEMARCNGDALQAMTLYESAIQHATEYGFVQDEALACELYAGFWLDRKNERVGRLYLKESYYAYSRWGATAKLAQLEKAFPDLLPLPEGDFRPAVEIGRATRGQSTSSSETAAAGLDFNTVVKAAQAISGEMALDQLIQKLMKIVIENAAAQSGYLLLEQNGELAISAAGSVDREEVSVLPQRSNAGNGSPTLPQSVINYVKRTHAHLVIADAENDARFVNDPYVMAKKPKSILCTPILNQGRLIGVLYLENNLTADAFTPHRIEMMQILCAQAAIALENSRLYEDMKQEIAERKRAEEILRAITAGTAEVTGADFFRSLVRQLAAALQMKYAFIAECTDSTKTRVRTLAFWKGDDYGDNFEYPLAGTPCERVVGGEMCVHPQQVQALFPNDKDLAALNAESYLGIPLHSSSQEIVGHLALLDVRALPEHSRYLPILKIFAARAAVELERKRAETALQKAHSELEQRVQMRTEELSNANTLLTQQINERLQAEQALKQSERRLTLALDATRDGLYDWDIPSGKAFISDNYYKMLQHEPDEFEIDFDKWQALLHPDDLPVAIQQLQDYFDGKTEAYSVEYRLLCKDGSYKWVHNRGQIVEYDKKGKPKRMIGTNADISARKHAEQALRDSEERFRRLFEHAGDAFFVVNVDGKFVDVNQEACRGLGYTREELLTKAVKDLNENWTAERIGDLMQRLLLGEPVKFEATHRRKDGSIFPVEIQAALLEVGENPTLLALARDITERKQFEVTLQEAKEAAEAANRAKSEFLANMSHEFRTPLNGILGYTQILRRDPKLSDSQRGGLDIIERSGEHLLTLINDILDLSKIEAGKLELDIIEFDLLEFLKNIVEVNRIRAEQKDLSFNYQARSALPQIVKGDEKRLRQVLLNLLSNAVKFTDAGGVTFSAECLKLEAGVAALRFEVEDTGVGIPASKLQEIFLPFQQVRRRNKPIEGTGLGLSITQNIIKLMRGDLKVESKPGKGSRFQVKVELPIVAMTSALVKKPEKRIVGFSGPVKKILIVDDKWENRAVLSNMLKPLGFNVAEAADGRDAIKQACAFKPDLILMDLIMPVMDGFQATRKIRKLKRLKDVRVIALSASAFEHNRQQSLEAGCEDFIPKPVRSEVLFKKLRTHLKLKWTYDHETGDTLTVDLDAGVPSQPLTGPPPALAIQLNELAMMGDVQAILAKLDELEKNDGQLHAFNSELRRLAKNYSMKKIREFLKPFLKNME
jgi:PAS domain S-box-containing protein